MNKGLLAFLAILVTGVIVDGAVRYKLEWVDDLDWSYLLF